MAKHAHEMTDLPNLCLAGGVALNCVANGRILREGPFRQIWIQPASGDAGGALGAALLGWYQYQQQPRKVSTTRDAQRGSFLGPEFKAEEFLRREAIPFEELDDDQLMDRVAQLIEEGKVVGWVQGRMEFGPRALGNRSILGDARSPEMQERLNLKIKFRESFRPFAPSVLRERVADYFQMSEESPYMLLVAPVKESICLNGERRGEEPDFLTRLKTARSSLPAITHVDCSARIQTISAEDNPRFHRLLREFERKTGCAVVVNTSFNVRGEPPVCTPEDAFRCFMRTGMDYLVLGNCLLDKCKQDPSKIVKGQPVDVLD
jgi:carbamoyltransferase